MQFLFSLEHTIYNKTLHLEFSGELVGKIQSSYQTKVVVIINCIMVSGKDRLCYKSFVSLWLYFVSYNMTWLQKSIIIMIFNNVNQIHPLNTQITI